MSDISNTSACSTIVIFEDENERVPMCSQGQQSSLEAMPEVDLELRLGPCRVYNGGSANQDQTINGIEKHPQDPDGSQKNVGHKQPVERDIKLTCSICLDALRDESCTTCGHVFCTPCINMAVITQGRCPTCRKVVHFRGIRRIYLPKVKA